MRWLLLGSEITDEHEERAFRGGLTEGLLYSQHGSVFLEMEENSSLVQEKVSRAFPEAKRVEGHLRNENLRQRAVVAGLIKDEGPESFDEYKCTVEQTMAAGVSEEDLLDTLEDLIRIAEQNGMGGPPEDIPGE